MFREHANTDTLEDRPPELTVIGELLGRLARIEATLEQLLQQKTAKDWYTTDEVAEILGKAPFTVREWCRNRRVKAAKRDCGRGNAREWVISHEELTRIRNEGLLPDEWR
ncbi:MAG TPA: helix-turn-helix domain-containing protein [Pirellulales bacterium]|nr:helix-turn-helix domain-containing protein [Pirellulales bacterium]